MTDDHEFLKNISNINVFFPEEKEAKTYPRDLRKNEMKECQKKLIGIIEKTHKIDSIKELSKIEKNYKEIRDIIKEIEDIEDVLSEKIEEYKTQILCTKENKIKKTKIDIALLEDHHNASLIAIKELKIDRKYIIKDRENIPVDELTNMSTKRNKILKRIRRYK